MFKKENLIRDRFNAGVSLNGNNVEQQSQQEASQDARYQEEKRMQQIMVEEQNAAEKRQAEKKRAEDKKILEDAVAKKNKRESDRNDWNMGTERVFGKVNGTPFVIERSAGSKGYHAGEGTYEERPSGQISIKLKSSKTTAHADGKFHKHGSHWDGSNGRQDGFLKSTADFHGSINNYVLKK